MSVIIAPIVVQYRNLGLGGWALVVVLLAALVWAVWKSKSPAPSIGDPDIAPAPGD